MEKITKWLLISVAVVAVTTFAACSDDDDKTVKPLTPLFEEPLKIRCNVNGVEEINFTTSEAWRMTSGAIWCLLSTDGENFAYDVTGDAGNNRVYITVNADAQEFDETTAVLNVVRNGEKEHVATVYRSPKGYELVVKDAAGSVCDSIIITSAGSIEFSVEANFAFGVSAAPEWVDIFDVAAETQESKKFRVTVREEYDPFPSSATIEFMNSDNTVSYPYIISFTGMQPEALRVSGNDSWGWSLSADGAEFSNSNPLSGKSVVYNGGVPYTVKTLRYDCHYLFFSEEDDKLTLMAPEESWLHVSKDAANASNIEVSGDAFPAETEGSRKGYVYAVPAAKYDAFMAIYDAVSDISFIDSTYNNVLMEVTQESDYVDLSKGFTVLRNMYEPLDCFEENDTTYINLINKNYPVDEIFAVSVDAGMYIQAFPHLTDKHWEGWRDESTIVIDTDGNVVDKSTLGFEIGMDAGENYYISLMAQNEPLIIILKGVDGTYLKALVVRSGITLDPGTGFVVKYKMIEDVPCELETDMELAAAIIEKHGTKEIYSVKSRVGRTLQIFPHLTDAVWGGGNLGSTLIFETDGTPIEYDEVSFETAMDSDDNYYVSSTVKKRPYVLVFVGLDGHNIKAIVIKPNS